MKILVTGATGFIGSHLVEKLGASGHEIIATARSLERPWPVNDKVQFIKHDLYEKNPNLFDFFQCPNLVIHLAWNYLDDYRSPAHIEKELPAHRHFLATLIAQGLSKLAVTGTCLEYGLQEGCLSEKMETQPVIPYAEAKDTLRKFLFNLRSEFNFDLTWIRLFYTYGKGQQQKSILQQLEHAIQLGENEFNMSSGEQWRDYLPVEMMASYIMRLALSSSRGEIVNCCSGKPVSIKELVTSYLEQRGVNMKLNLGVYPYVDYEPFRFWGDTSRLKEIIGESA